MILGAILTQNTSWRNASLALAALRRAGLLRLDRLDRCPMGRLASVIRPAGAYRQKARKIRAFLDYLGRSHAGSLTRMAKRPTLELRTALLGVWGIGPETADSILLYAFHRPVFVVDAYAGRILARHGLVPAVARYEERRRFLEEQLPASVELFNDFHAQIVWLGQVHCRPRPCCDGCPLEPFLPAGTLRRPVRGKKTGN